MRNLCSFHAVLLGIQGAGFTHNLPPPLQPYARAEDYYVALWNETSNGSCLPHLFSWLRQAALRPTDQVELIIVFASYTLPVEVQNSQWEAESVEVLEADDLESSFPGQFATLSHFASYV